MLLALDETGQRIRPKKKTSAHCPACGRIVIPKLGLQKVHHWAHKIRSDCTYGLGMTQWHYRWIEKHYGKYDWEIEYTDGDRRYDCFSKLKRLVVEIQTRATYDYIVEKTDTILNRGLKVHWVLHEDSVASLERRHHSFTAKTLRRLVLLDVIEKYSDEPRVRFYIDSHARKTKGESSTGLLRLNPVSRSRASYNDYYNVPYERHTK